MPVKRSKCQRARDLFDNLVVGPDWRFWGPDLPRTEMEMKVSVRRQYGEWFAGLREEAEALLPLLAPKPARSPTPRRPSAKSKPAKRRPGRSA